MRNINTFLKSLEWIKVNTIDGKGIAVTSKQKIIYPEVTGYYIPTLINWGERELAISYARHLCSIQKNDGSWYDYNDEDPYVFDSAQILKGLLSIRKVLPEVDESIIKGCDWILSNMHPDGRLTTPSKDAWGGDENFCSELIHIYCLSPIKEAGLIFNKTEYIDSVNKILEYYKNNYFEKITNFSLLSHFYAYVMEGLFDLGEIDLCRECMLKLEKHRNIFGAIPGLNNVNWVCSTGLFQLAVVWYKLGDLNRGNSLFDCASKLQNKTGGWFGSYPSSGIFSMLVGKKYRPYYFPNEEISWAVKYFLDSLALKEKLEFEKQAPLFLENIDANDGRYVLVKEYICMLEQKSRGPINVCDVGCGKGRYIKRLISDFPNNNYFVSDLSESVMSSIDNVLDKKQGPFTNIPYDDNKFDFVYACESYEHSINLKSSFDELYRITKPGGLFLILDKPIDKLGSLKIDEWEQWISDEDITSFSKQHDCTLEIVKSVSYENKNDGLFRAWIITKG